MERNIKEGFAVLFWENGTKFVGSFVKNQAKGYGKFTHLSGDQYLGNYKSS